MIILTARWRGSQVVLGVVQEVFRALAGGFNHSRSVSRPLHSFFFFFCICTLHNVQAYEVVAFPRGHVLLHQMRNTFPQIFWPLLKGGFQWFFVSGVAHFLFSCNMIHCYSRDFIFGWSKRRQSIFMEGGSSVNSISLILNLRPGNIVTLRYITSPLSSHLLG